MSPRISVVITTSRGAFPFAGRPELDCLEPVARTLAEQTFRDFELILIDSHWKARPDWFLAHPQPYPVIHAPAAPNHWHEVERSGACAQINRGLAWATGELVWLGSENCLYPPHFLALAWDIYQTGMLPSAWHVRCVAERLEQPAPCPATFRLLDYTEQHVRPGDVDHRALPFISSPSLQHYHVDHANFFNHSGVPHDLWIELNGYDEAFDGDLTLSDCDVGSRLDLLGHGSKLRMHRDLYVVKNGGGGGYKGNVGIKCNYALYLRNRTLKLARATQELDEGDLRYLRDTICGNVCSIRERCRTNPAAGEHRLYPFCGDGNDPLYQHWLRRPPRSDLQNEIGKRREGQTPYDRATITP